MQNLQFKDALNRQKVQQVENEYEYQAKQLQDLTLQLMKLEAQREKDCEMLVQQEELLVQLKKNLHNKQNQEQTFNPNTSIMKEKKPTVKFYRTENEKISSNLNHLVKGNFEIEGKIMGKFSNINA
mmetsp:Transcript_8579/g.7915  ORF Transcript_8579/g.7915 Transcript_8579/m.7915 type:complete len:126 (+) Transcript_8579:37-414(+)